MHRGGSEDGDETDCPVRHGRRLRLPFIRRRRHRHHMPAAQREQWYDDDDDDDVDVVYHSSSDAESIYSNDADLPAIDSSHETIDLPRLLDPLHGYDDHTYPTHGYGHQGYPRFRDGRRGPLTLLNRVAGGPHHGLFEQEYDLDDGYGRGRGELFEIEDARSYHRHRPSYGSVSSY